MLEVGPGRALSELAERIDANIRLLRGALTRVIAHSSLLNRPLSSELIAEIVPITIAIGSATTMVPRASWRVAGIRASADINAVARVMPAEGPSFGIAPSGM